MHNVLPLIDPGERFLLFWLPRCGSTTLAAWFFNAIGEGERLRGASAHSVRAEWQKAHAPDTATLERLYVDPSVDRYVLGRDPLDRAVSSYYLLLAAPPSAQWRKILEAHPELDPERRLSFRGFIDFLETTDLIGGDLHWRLQTASDWAVRDLEMTDILRVESLEADLNKISARYGLAGVIKRASVTPRAEVEAAPANLADLDRLALKEALPSDERGRIQLPDYQIFLSDPNLVARIRRIYAPDFERLGY
jgi:hypothetical protein